MTKRVITWDWKGQPDTEQLSMYLTELAGVYVKDVTNTGGDEYAWVLSTDPMTSEEAAEEYRLWRDNEIDD